MSTTQDTTVAAEPVSGSSRAEAFSDGVIAIAITLLVLEVKVPVVAEGSLWTALKHEWPAFLGYGVSFVIIGIMWVNHHAMFERVARVDRWFLFLNLALLMGIAFLPFPTDLLATYLRSGRNASTAAVIYSTTMVYIGLGFAALWAYLFRHPALLHPGLDTAVLRRQTRRGLAGPVVYGLTIPLAYVSPLLCLVLYAALAIFFAVTASGGPLGRLLRPR